MDIKTITNENFETEVVQSQKLVLIDFYAPWCAPCKKTALLIEELSKELSYVKICKINVDEQPRLATSLSVLSIPTMLVFKNGIKTKTSIGVKSKAEIISMLH